MSLDALTADTRAALDLLDKYSRKTLGKQIRVRSTVRTCEQQNALYAQGRTAPGQIVTGARGCLSWHVLGRAVDIDLERGTGAEYQVLGEYWETLGGSWGGRFSNIDDPGHFEWHPGIKIESVCPNPDNCRDGQHRSQTIALTYPNVGSSKWFQAFAVAGAMFGGFLYLKRK